MSLRREAASGVRWTTAASIGATTLGYIQLAILTRLLTRADFGLMTMLTTVIGFAAVFADAGISNALIARQHPTRDQLSSLYWVTILAGVLVTGVTAALTPLVVSFYHEPSLAGPYLWACASFLIIPWGQQFQMLLQKALRFRLLAVIELIAQVVALTVAVVAALSGAGVYALVWASLTLVTARALALVAVGWSDWRPALHFARADLRGYMGFGAFQLGERTLTYLAANVDYLLIGRFLGPSQLGVYSIAYQLVVLPVARINPVLTRVAFPVLARRQDDDGALRRGYSELIELLAFVTFPLFAGLLVLAPLAVPILFGARFAASAVLVQILVLTGVTKVLSNPTGSLYLAKVRADVGFWVNLAATVATVAAIAAAVSSGIQAVAWAHTLLGIGFFFVELAVLRWLVGLAPRSYLARVARPAVTSVVMAVTVGLTYLALRGTATAPLVLLLGLVAQGAAIYLGLYWLRGRDYLRTLWRLLIGRGPVPA